MKILFLLTTVHGFKRSNHLLFANSFRRAGFDVYFARIDTLAVEDGEVFARQVRVDRDVEVDDTFELGLEYGPVADVDLVWAMNQAHPALQRDVSQILWLLAQRCRFVNSLEAMFFLNNKTILPAVVGRAHAVEGYVSHDCARLWDIVTDHAHEPWVTKPTNGGLGADVFVLRPGDSNRKAILQSMTGNEFAGVEIFNAASVGVVSKYSLLQRFVRYEGRYEKRVVLAAGVVMPCYATVLPPDDHRSNRIHGSDKVLCDLTPEEDAFCRKLARTLTAHGANYVAIDMLYPVVFEINVVNPGGLQTLLRLSGVDLTGQAVEHILVALGLRNGDDECAWASAAALSASWTASPPAVSAAR